MWRQIAKRVARFPMSERDLLEFSKRLVANPPVSDEVRSYLTTRKNTDGRSAQDVWRDEFKLILGFIAAEKTWALQKRKLINLCVAAVHWLALWRAVSVESRISLWRSYVEGKGEFATNPEDAWPSILAKLHYFAALQFAVLAVVGRGCYGTGRALYRHLESLMGMRQHLIEKGVVLNRGILDIASSDYRLGASLVAQRNEQIYPLDMKLFELLREFAHQIEAGTVDVDAIATQWRDLSNERNAKIVALDLDLQPTSELG